MLTKKLLTRALKRRLPSRIKAKASTAAPAEEAPRSPECELFALAVGGGDGHRATAYDRLRAMTAEERRRLRAAIERLDGLLDQVALDLHMERQVPKLNGGRQNHES